MRWSDVQVIPVALSKRSNMQPLFNLPDKDKPHPARYSDALLTTFARMLQGNNCILDPFGGTGKIFLLEHWLPDARIEAVEIEPEWAALNPRITLGNALHLPWDDKYFDAVCTSPSYANRMADGLRNPVNWARDYTYITYAQKLGHKLHSDNSGAMQWGSEYRVFHIAAWTEARRVLQPNSKFVLNIKDHIRAGMVQPVTQWHIEALESLGFILQEHARVDCPGMRWGQNGKARVDYESVILFTKEV